MTPHQILIVGIRVLVIFWFLSLIGQAAALPGTIQNTDISAKPFLITLVLQLVAIVVLWLFPATLASKLLRASNVQVQPSAVPFDEWRDLVFVGVGVFVLARAIPDIIYWSILALAPESSFPDFSFEQQANLVLSLIDLTIGLTLTLGAKGIAALIQKGRRVGVPQT
ncbi:hypothetical protein [Steroidobacter agaridevorans]|uniref:hypothetical protein n=1 Tax=Steroidobacter agaridevorans TaxID=2695856 RepID=UPI00132A3413|nr:hypothetical protein [Steroidobacter agaridevorans]GFE88715.1 hypothetical protein GCM10011488_36690 [Steroidobacter agaridevorans]